MALEQLSAFTKGLAQSILGEVENIGIDQFALLRSSELKHEHEILSRFIKAAKPEIDYSEIKNFSAFARAVNAAKNLGGIKKEPESKEEFEYLILESDQCQRTKFYLALLERTAWYELRLFESPTERNQGDYFFRDSWSIKYLLKLIQRDVDISVVAKPTFDWIAAHRYFYFVANHTSKFVDGFYSGLKGSPLIEEVRESLIAYRSHIYDGCADMAQANLLVQKIDELLGNGVWQIIFPVEIWAEAAVKDLISMDETSLANWRKLLEHCKTINSAKPTKKWLNEGTIFIDKIGIENFRERVIDWFSLFDEGCRDFYLGVDKNNGGSRIFVNETNGKIIRGLVFLSIFAADEALTKAVSKVAQSAYRKIPSVGPRSIKIGNASIYALSQMSTSESLAQLAILDSRLKSQTALKNIEKAQTIVATKAGVSAEELEEMSVPNYGLVAGKLSSKFENHDVDIIVSGTKAVFSYKNETGKEIKSAPAKLKELFATELKRLKAVSKDIEAMLSAQTLRIEQFYLEERSWDFLVFKERFIDHGLVGTIGKRLIWEFNKGDKSCSAIYCEGTFVSSDRNAVDWFDDTTTVTLWHPIFEESSVVQNWREFLLEKQVRQPFKQAFREIYIVTDAELRTDIYSNRFAAHILRQNQFRALTVARKWKSQYKLLNVDQDDLPTHKLIPIHGIRAEFWVEGVGSEFGVDTNEQGAFIYMATDQIRFYDAKQQIIAIANVPAIVLSVIMRDVDLFVGVCSIGNDPGWMDGGAENARFNAYWSAYSFGDLAASAEFRKAALQMIIPKMKIASQCSFADKYLIVKGALRTYKIHIGSGNILMEPGDQYLCIVQKQSVEMRSDKVFLPFEGDTRLSIILSKAIMLADDTKILDETITRQIRRM